ncbi:MAG: threo-3-hydroxy-L-aspartate ammonia-lyase [Burkholderiaceae bacterium]|nr:threo-3-hydroxy-L-aspartate ammonia-lyase [Burkholderiaceae bacterium]
MTLAISYADIAAARTRLQGVAHRTPVMTSQAADARTGARLFFKCENLQRTGSFKFRGAYNALAQLPAAQRARGVVAFSSGNHAQAVALAARLLGIPATIVMPQDAPAIKIEATRAYGAQIIFYDRYREDREAVGRALAAERGLALIPPFDHPHVMAGQGTAAAELIEEVGALDMLVVCVGGGGLISGCAIAAAQLAPNCRVIGVEPQAGNDVQQSLAAGRIVRIPVPQTIADGAQTQQPGALTFPVIQARVAEIVTVADAALVRAMRFFAERMKLVVEPTGALAAAACFERLPLAGQRVGVIVSGGNVDLVRYAALLTRDAD